MERNTLTVKQAQALCNRELKDLIKAKNGYYIPAMRDIARTVDRITDIRDVITYLHTLNDKVGAYEVLAGQLLDVITLNYLYTHLPIGATIFYINLASGHGAYYLLYVPVSSAKYGLEMINITPDIAKACGYEQTKLTVKTTLNGFGLYKEHYPLYCGNIVDDDIVNGLSNLSQLLYNTKQSFQYCKLATDVR